MHEIGKSCRAVTEFLVAIVMIVSCHDRAVSDGLPSLEDIRSAWQAIDQANADCEVAWKERLTYYPGAYPTPPHLGQIPAVPEALLECGVDGVFRVNGVDWIVERSGPQYSGLLHKIIPIRSSFGSVGGTTYSEWGSNNTALPSDKDFPIGFIAEPSTSLPFRLEQFPAIFTFRPSMLNFGGLYSIDVQQFTVVGGVDVDGKSAILLSRQRIFGRNDLWVDKQSLLPLRFQQWLRDGDAWNVQVEWGVRYDAESHPAGWHLTEFSDQTHDPTRHVEASEIRRKAIADSKPLAFVFTTGTLVVDQRDQHSKHFQTQKALLRLKGADNKADYTSLRSKYIGSEIDVTAMVVGTAICIAMAAGIVFLRRIGK